MKQNWLVSLHPSPLSNRTPPSVRRIVRRCTMLRQLRGGEPMYYPKEYKWHKLRMTVSPVRYTTLHYRNKWQVDGSNLWILKPLALNVLLVPNHCCAVSVELLALTPCRDDGRTQNWLYIELWRASLTLPRWDGHNDKQGSRNQNIRIIDVINFSCISDEFTVVTFFLLLESTS